MRKQAQGLLHADPRAGTELDPDTHARADADA